MDNFKFSLVQHPAYIYKKKSTRPHDFILIVEKNEKYSLPFIFQLLLFVVTFKTIIGYR